MMDYIHIEKPAEKRAGKVIEEDKARPTIHSSHLPDASVNIIGKTSVISGRWNLSKSARY